MTKQAATQLPLQKTKTVYLIDGTAYIYRAYHAIRGLADSEGFPTNAIFGYTKMLLKLIETKAPEYIAMFFDAKGPTFRHEMYKDYKANRPPRPDDLVVQLPYIKKMTDAFNITVFEKSGFEADDLIGSCARQAEDAGFDVVMVTGDKDFNQLVTAKAMIWDPMKDKTVTLDVIRKTFGVEPDKIIEIMGLSGDSSDNIPGVPGIGPKTALTLIKTFGTMQKLYEQVDTITKKKQHENLVKFKEQALLSRSLVTIDTQAPVSFDPDALKSQAPDQDALYDLFKTLEFRQLQKAFPRPTDLSQKSYYTILDMAALNNLITRLETASLFAVDTETTAANPMRASLVGLSFALEPDVAYYIPCAHDYTGVPGQLDSSVVLDALRPVLENPDIQKVGQNIKYDQIVLARHGVLLGGIAFDTMLASYLINPSKRAHNLDRIALDFLDHQTITYTDVVGKGRQALKSFAQVPIDKATPYACEDADITLAAYQILAPQLEKMKLTELMSQAEMPLVDVLAKMELTGICVDQEKLHELSGLFESQLETLKDEIYALAGEPRKEDAGRWKPLSAYMAAGKEAAAKAARQRKTAAPDRVRSAPRKATLQPPSPKPRSKPVQRGVKAAPPIPPVSVKKSFNAQIATFFILLLSLLIRRIKSSKSMLHTVIISVILLTVAMPALIIVSFESEPGHEVEYNIRSEPLTVTISEYKKQFNLDSKGRPKVFTKNRLKDMGNGTVADWSSGLLWQQVGSHESLDYEKAKDYVRGLNHKEFAGYNDWRLPTVSELLSLVEKSVQSHGLYINPIFDTSKSWCWSADKIKSSSGRAWSVGFHNGQVDWLNHFNAVDVRVVRQGPFLNYLGMAFVYIPPRKFVMGSPNGKPGRDIDEKPHNVVLTRGFYMQTTEVTQGQWKKVMEKNPSRFLRCGDDCPVENVSWNEVQEFIKKLNQKEGTKKYHLPTEAQWEYACRAGTQTSFAFGQCLSIDQANYDGSHPLQGCPKGKYRNKTIAVASCEPNQWGLYDMHGNVWEWCQNWYGVYPQGTVKDPAGPDSGLHRVIRGGGWNYNARNCRSAYRSKNTPFSRGNYLGFRLVRSLP